ncbi:phage tail tube protein [Deefgea piscis]|uniref:phage tail tube protein n=1 Tax=Deefgea piscis TaxID=2739061 RepID=UPI001C818034|nr:phage tail tube protein [Deefgea piscis]QZA80861.1 hypothetical protein K4H25_15425 [Deefgea piscis]
MPTPSKFFKKLLALAKIETAYGTDSTPTGALNAILMRNVTLTPLEQETESLEYIRPYFGNSPDIPVVNRAKVEFEVALSGSGTVGTVPAWGALARACNMSETITAGVSVIYQPVSAGSESITLYVYLDGLLHKIFGARGSISASLVATKTPTLKFSFTGLFQPVTDTAAPVVDFSKWVDPLPVSTQATPTFNLHGATDLALESFSFDLGNAIEHRVMVGLEEVVVADRKASGKAVVQMGTIASKDWFAVARSGAAGVLQLIQGATAGNKVQIDAPNMQISKPNYVNSKGVAMISLDLSFNPTTLGNNELKITVL